MAIAAVPAAHQAEALPIRLLGNGQNDPVAGTGQFERSGNGADRPGAIGQIPHVLARETIVTGEIVHVDVPGRRRSDQYEQQHK